jgi:DNA-directed RNA polymerase subunit RPC12/RpoP
MKIMADITCPKCSSDDLKMRWHNWMIYEPFYFGLGGTDHMHYWCNRCRYGWIVKDD